MTLQMLEIQSGKYKGKRVKVTEVEVIVGRDEGAKIRIASEEVSRKHCVLQACPDGILVKDLDSSNGTFINGRPIQGEALLEPGCTLTVGPMTFKLLGEPKSTPRPIPVKIPKVAAGDAGVQEDDIASWLSEESPVPSTSDTTIIKWPSGDSSVEIPVHLVTTAASLQGTPGSPQRRREFKSTAEEAQDIIARWKAQQAAQAQQ
jgi:pSer/pThr/pTyr-binding forkhead associated (FHA) protein